MTPTQINEAIAKAAGWTNVHWYEDNAGPGMLCGQPPTKLNANWEVVDQHDKQIHDFQGSLDAINQAERYAKEHLMNGDQWESYGKELERIHPAAVLSVTSNNATVFEHIDYHDFATLMVELTAAQRATTLVKVLGLWTD